ncbi:MAG: nuclear transport factor 2 family protein [Flavobacteriaceae bacterium]|nr:DUF4440 domain-containing protein [Bacteroidia bacterium]NNL15895.1 nuclear transport factor 2 family protein [Flavobacteriaceae bacterium]
MRSKIFLIIMLLGIISSCQQKNQTESPEVLKKVLFNFYDGVKNKDFDMIIDVTTPDFIAFIDGKIWSTDSMINTLKSYPPYIAEYSFDDFKINMADSIGNINYFIRGDFVFNDTLNLRFDWLESATFTKVENQWKMNFMHTTTKK